MKKHLYTSLSMAALLALPASAVVVITNTASSGDSVGTSSITLQTGAASGTQNGWEINSVTLAYVGPGPTPSLTINGVTVAGTLVGAGQAGQIFNFDFTGQGVQAFALDSITIDAPQANGAFGANNSALIVPATSNTDPNSLGWTQTTSSINGGADTWAELSVDADRVTIVPEPSSALLLGFAGIGLATRRRR